MFNFDNVPNRRGTRSVKWDNADKLYGGENHEDNAAYYTAESHDVLFAAPTKVGHTFLGWYADENYTQKITAIAAGSTGESCLDRGSLRFGCGGHCNFDLWQPQEKAVTEYFILRRKIV